jgi:hypothetical protein
VERSLPLPLNERKNNEAITAFITTAYRSICPVCDS